MIAVSRLNRLRIGFGKSLTFIFILCFLFCNLFLSNAFPSGVHHPDRIITIGVLAKRGAQRCLEKWSPTAEYLTASIHGYSFKIMPLDFKEINDVVGRGDVDFVLANSSIYVELEYLFGVRRIATMQNLRQGFPYTVFGGVIFSKSDRAEIASLDDLKGKSFAAVEENSFGGWIMAWRELLNQGIDPYQDFAGLRFEGTHDAVVHAVKNGTVDAGTVRTDTLERMTREGLIDLQQFSVIGKDATMDAMNPADKGFPFLHSTRLYPEWPFAAAKGTDSHLIKHVAVALLNVPPESPAAIDAQVAGWAPPLHYQSVHECLQELRIGPYRNLGRISFGDVVRQYRHWILLLLFILFLLTVGTFIVLRLNRKLYQAKKMVTKARDKLEERVRQRTTELRELNANLKTEVAVRQQAEENTRRTYAELEQVFNSAAIGMTLIDRDFNILRVNTTFSNLLGIDREGVVGRKCYEIFPSSRCDTPGCPLNQLLAGKELVEEEDEKENADGRKIPCTVTATPFRAQDGELIGMVEAFKDISEWKRDEQALAAYTRELARSNAELQQFAYVASHDLQEPLRMVASYVQLLARRYKDKLDQDADDFINYAVDGTKRMQQLIQDLLTYSRIKTKAKPFEPADCESVLKKVLANLRLAVEDNNAEVTHDPLPTVPADALQLGQLLQNLIGNAIKFHGGEPPRIHVSAEREGNGWLFSVRDNGIGIDAEYADRIFEIFQRLHNKEQYGGTGIGLAICKKIVERHGGGIWVESKEGEGATFFFTLPDKEGIQQ